MNGKKTIPEVFILESLHQNYTKEGEIIHQILNIGGRSPYFKYFQTRDEVQSTIQAFVESHCRYLHISSHGSHECLNSTNIQSQKGILLADSGILNKTDVREFQRL